MSGAVGTWRKRVKVWSLSAIIVFPFATLMLAKLFDSAVLGWLFGLTLMFGVAIAPVVLLVCIGLWLVARLRGGPATLALQIDRGSVHASDDAPSRQITLHSRATVRAMVERAIDDNYLPRISGGKATWVVEASGRTADRSPSPIAVCAQQWMAPEFLVSADALASAHVGSVAPRLNFRYLCQDDPAAVFAQLSSRAATA